MLDIFAGVQAQAAASCAEKGQENQAPELGGQSVLVFNVGHTELVAGLAVDHNGEPGVGALPWVILFLRDIVHIQVSVRVHSRFEFLVVVDLGLSRRNRGVRILIALLPVVNRRHDFELLYIYPISLLVQPGPPLLDRFNFIL